MNHWYLSILFVFLSLGLAHSQSSAELKKKQKQLNENISYTEKLLGQIQEDTKNSRTIITLVDKKINQREELILSIREEISLLDQKISRNEDLIDALEADINRLKEEYAKMVVQAYKTRNATDKVMYIFASEDFTQAYHRIKYMQQLSEYRKRQAEAIIHTQQSLERKRSALEEIRAQKNAILHEQNQEKLTLSREKEEKEKQLKALTGKESQYKKELAQAQKKAEELRVAIKKAIEREIELKNAAAKKSNSTKGAPAVVALTPEARELSNNFVANKGKLPWPVDKGEITSYFGEQPHPFLKGIKIKNNGITISTTEGARARAVFDGEVSKIIILPGAGKIVMLRHGEYITVYTNLKETFVSTGDKVKTKEELGVVLTDKGKTEFEFWLWKDTLLLDPAFWIFKAR